MTGCTKIGLGCDNCYAESFDERWREGERRPHQVRGKSHLKCEVLTRINQS
ncbi:phage Gp37/Gp68 family protein [Mesorhizobium sp. P16.1]|uniref:phage Gp37/Gp68 family protein n=1 Tax=unclassified Mesorhizobium TaxID=325217 RepID=UPI0021A5EAE4|nr:MULTISPECIES: phage Gp37/Gp68 family protein [unclassified Mesorhizobium]MCT2580889.1 phage Gp37/Gp68 family protein [Mesorhizobium sp. P13.3]MDF3169972.1 phage Gp37/Gp68 family protein [Mesorhizobium sp. P16.1]MDF3181300.1 phage Gp37/Gp68 family protein [Mesorhizobium sp. P17.1]MDF3186851.1 phage Gp37/Gp68 family protein [Mesorhizobium sp. ICCV3110.1]